MTESPLLQGLLRDAGTDGRKLEMLLRQIADGATAAAAGHLQLQQQQQKTPQDPATLEALASLAATDPGRFRTKPVLDALIALMQGPATSKRHQAAAAAAAAASAAAAADPTTSSLQDPRVLASRLLHSALRGVKEWPLLLITTYMTDSLGPRAWVEHAGCRPFVDNIRTAWDPSIALVPPSAHVDDGGHDRAAASIAQVTAQSSAANFSSSGGGGGAGSDSSSGEEMEVEEGVGTVVASGSVPIAHKRVTAAADTWPELLRGGLHAGEGPALADRCACRPVCAGEAARLT